MTEQTKNCVTVKILHYRNGAGCLDMPAFQRRTQEFCTGGRGGSTNSVEEREKGDLEGGSPLVRGSGGSCNLVQEISFHIVKFS